MGTLCRAAPVTRLISNRDTGQGCQGVTAGYVATGANLGATSVTVVACLKSFTGPNGGWLARLYQNTSASLSGATQLGAQMGAYGAQCPSTQTIVFSGISITQPYLFVWFNMNQPGCCGFWTIVSADDNFAGGYCAAGVQLKPAANFVYYLTPGLIDVWLASVGMPWLAPFFTGFWFTTLDAQHLCTALPPIGPGTLTADPDSTSPGVLYDLLRAIAWTQVCQCSSTGTPPPPPVPAQPPGVAPLPTTTCSTDLCATLVDIWQDQALNGKIIRQAYTLLQTLQRRTLPFAWIASTPATGLTGTGFISAPDTLGAVVSLTSVRSGWGHTADDPRRLIPSVGGLQASDGTSYDDWRLLHYDHQVVLLEAPWSAGIRYNLKPGITATITPLKPEP